MEISDIKQILSLYKKRTPKQKVYIFKNSATGLFKIGITCDLEKRIKALSKACGSTLTLIKSVESNAPRSCEWLLHDFFSENRKVGEWFSLSKKELESAFLVMDVAQQSYSDHKATKCG